MIIIKKAKMDQESNKRLEVFQSEGHADPTHQSSNSKIVDLEATQPLP